VDSEITKDPMTILRLTLFANPEILIVPCGKK
jgi:hypothetical protein